MNATFAQIGRFVHPHMALAAVLLAGVPLIIHLINRRRYRRHPWAAMQFLAPAGRRGRRTRNPQQWLLLAVRTAAVLCLGLAIARPLLSPGTLPLAGEGAVDRIIVLDDSLSMQMTGAGDRSRYQRASDAARRLVDTFAPGDPISIVTMSDPPRIHLRAAIDRRAVRRTLDDLAPTARGTDAPQALATCVDLLDRNEPSPGGADVYVLTDLAAPSWHAVEGAARLDPARSGREGRLHVLSCADSATNLAITRLATRDALVTSDAAPRLFAEIANFGPQPVGPRLLEVIRDGCIARRVNLPEIPANERIQVEFTVGVGHKPLAEIEVRLAPPHADGLPEDDRRRIVLSGARSLPVLVVEGRHGTRPTDGDAGYLVTALAPDDCGEETSPIRPTMTTAAGLRDHALPEYDAVIICNAARLPESAWARLGEYVRGGGGLLITAGANLDLDHYNVAAGRTGVGLLPARLASAPPQVDRPVRFLAAEPTSGSTGGFVFAPGSSLWRSRVDRHLKVSDLAPGAKVLMRFSNGDPAIVSCGSGNGRTALLATSVDMSWTNLPAKGDFVALAHMLVGHLCGPDADDAEVYVGGRFRLPVDSLWDGRPVRVLAPGREEAAAVVKRIEDRRVAVTCELTTPGFHRVVGPGRETAFAVNVDPAESDPSSIGRRGLERILAGPFTFDENVGDFLERADTATAAEPAPALAHLALLLLVCESWAANRVVKR